MVLLASACGSGGSDNGSNRLSPAAYRAQLKTIARESDTAQHALEKAFNAKATSQLVKVLSTFAAAEKRIGDQVDALNPPANAEAANSELAKGLRDTDENVRAVLPHVKNLPTAAAGIAYLRKTPPTNGGKEVDAALAKLKKLGYIQSVS
jgi:hypothetical protein